MNASRQISIARIALEIIVCQLARAHQYEDNIADIFLNPLPHKYLPVTWRHVTNKYGAQTISGHCQQLGLYLLVISSVDLYVIVGT